MRQFLGLLITLSLWAAFSTLVAKLSQAAARRLWLIAFTLVLGSGVAWMDAHAFVAKWAFKGDHPRDGLFALMDATAARPFVYRRLAPDVVRVVTDVAVERLPERAFGFFENGSRLYRYRGDWTGQESWGRRKAVAFHVAYALVALTFFGTLLAGAALLQAVRSCSWFEAVVTSSTAMCFAPLIFVGGGYLYDAPELMLWTTLLWAAVRGFWLASPVLFALMLVNKESAVLLLPALAPLLYRQGGWAMAAKWLAPLGVMGIGWTLYVHARYAHNPGGAMEFWLPGNLEFWGNPLHYFMLGPQHSTFLPSPRGANLVTLLIAVLPLRFGWRAARPDLRWATAIVAAILVPLLVTSCYRDEMRNLSLLYPLLFVCVVQGAHELMRSAAPESARVDVS